MTSIAIVGEAWGEQEERARAPFVGASGYELTRMLDEAGIRRADCFLTNVFNLRPEQE
jgi:uracil-DNA glycosylase family 4